MGVQQSGTRKKQKKNNNNKWKVKCQRVVSKSMLAFLVAYNPRGADRGE
jgi:hypothetical protein